MSNHYDSFSNKGKDCKKKHTSLNNQSSAYVGRMQVTQEQTRVFNTDFLCFFRFLLKLATGVITFLFSKKAIK